MGQLGGDQACLGSWDAACLTSPPTPTPPHLHFSSLPLPRPAYAGKYQNVLRECGQPVAQPLLPQSAAAAASGAPPAPLPPLVYDPTQPGNLQQHVRAAHAAASSALLSFLLRGSSSGGGGLLAVLRSVKHFFLLDQVRACGWRVTHNGWHCNGGRFTSPLLLPLGANFCNIDACYTHTHMVARFLPCAF